MKVMMLTAGEGTRLRPYTEKCPKPALPFMGVPLLTYPLSLVQGLQPMEIVFNTYHLPEELKKCVLNLSFSKARVHFSNESGQIRASAGGLYLARKHFQAESEFLLMNGDEVFIPGPSFEIEKILERHRKEKAMATLLVTENSGVGTRFGGVWSTDKDQVLDFGKGEKPKELHGWHYVGHMILSQEVFAEITSDDPKNIIYDVLLTLIKKGAKVLSYPISGSWYETGNKEDYLKAHQEVIAGMGNQTFQSQWLRKHIEAYEKSHFVIEKRTEALLWRAESSKIHSEAQMRGFGVLGDRVLVEKNAKFENSVLTDGYVLSENQVLRNEIGI